MLDPSAWRLHLISAEDFSEGNIASCVRWWVLYASLGCYVFVL